MKNKRPVYRSLFRKTEILVPYYLIKFKKGDLCFWYTIFYKDEKFIQSIQSL